MNILERTYRLEHLYPCRKDKARTLYNLGEVIFVLGNKLNPYSLENQLIELSSGNFEEQIQIIQEGLNTYTGKRLKFFFIGTNMKKVYNLFNV